MTKAEMRSRMTALLETIPGRDSAERSHAVAQRFMATEAWRRARIILCFLSMPNELDTAPLIAAAGRAGKRVAVPRIEKGVIRFLYLPAGEVELARDRWGIPVPEPAWEPFVPESTPGVLVATPGLAFDRQGNRLGRGKGYYDGFLRTARAASGTDLTAIGVCFSEQLVAEVPHDERDQRLDGVVSDSESVIVLLIRPGAVITLGGMGVIKSAFQIAMENSKDIEANKELVETNRFRDEGKKLVSKLLDEPTFDLKAALKAYDKRQLEWVREGLIQSILANLVLPVDEFSQKNGKRIGEAVAASVSDTRKVSMIFSQLETFFKEYLGERKRLVEAVEKQYGQVKKKKEEELSRQLGRPVKINPAADPEYQAMVRQYLSQLDTKYNEVLDGAKEEIRAIFAKSPA